MSNQPDGQYTRRIADIQEELAQLQASTRIVTTAEEMESLEREIRVLTDRLAAALLGQKVQASLDSDEMTEAERKLIEDHPKRMKSEGKKRSRRSHNVRK
jgi:hypothetical protein